MQQIEALQPAQRHMGETHQAFHLHVPGHGTNGTPAPCGPGMGTWPVLVQAVDRGLNDGPGTGQELALGDFYG